MTDPDPFDEIVRNLDLDLDFSEPDPAPSQEPVLGVPPACGGPSAASSASDDEDDVEEREDAQFYRRVEPRSIMPRNPRVLFAWLGVLGTPAAIMVTSLLHMIMPRPILLGCGLVFVASAIYLIAQLPERGPGEPFWPDDGAVL